jgi:DNA-directed RNA polymerase specialized sigma24 family protein
MARRIEAALQRLADGKLAYRDFARITRGDWCAMARYLMRMWRLPQGVDVDDVVQELHIGVMHAMRTHDPARGPLAQYVVFTACTKAKGWLHRQRGAGLHGNPGRRLSNFAEPFSALARADGDVGLVPHAVLGARAMQVQQNTEAAEWCIEWARAAGCAPTGKLRAATRAVQQANGSCTEAARLVYADVGLRLRYRLGHEGAARRLVREAVEYVAAKAAQ